MDKKQEAALPERKSEHESVLDDKQNESLADKFVRERRHEGLASQVFGRAQNHDEQAPLPELVLISRKLQLEAENFSPHLEYAVSNEGQKLLALAEKRIPETGHPSARKELLDFRKNMESFEQRARERGIDAAELRGTYDAIALLMEQRGDGFMKERQRIRVAEQILRNVSDPTGVDQGANVTCTQQTMENRLYTLNPSVAANLIASVALTGKFTGPDGTVVTIPKSNVQAHGPEAQNDPQNGERVLASQIFQVTSSNLYYTWRRNQNHPDGDYRYEFYDGKEHVILDPKDPSKYDPSKIGDQSPLSDMGPVATSNAMVHTYKLLTGKNIADVILVNNENRYDSDRDVAGFSTPQEMQDVLLRLKREGKLPAIVSVHSHRAEIKESSTSNASIGAEPFDDGHVALVTDIIEGKDGEATKVMLDNQWGRPSDRLGAQALTLEQAFTATRSLSATEYMRHMEDWMRQAKIEGKYSSRKLYNKLISFAEGAVAHWQVQAPVNPDQAAKDREEAFAAFEKMREKLPTRERNRLPAELPAEFRHRLLGEATGSVTPLRPEPTGRHRFK